MEAQSVEIQEMDLGSLQRDIERFVRNYPTQRAMTVKRSYSFTLLKRNKWTESVCTVPIVVHVGDTVYLFASLGGSATANASKRSDASRIYIVQRGFQLVLTFESGAIKWLPANQTLETEALSPGPMANKDNAA